MRWSKPPGLTPSLINGGGETTNAACHQFNQYRQSAELVTELALTNHAFVV